MTGYKWFVPVLVLAAMMTWITTTYGEENNVADKRAVYAKMIDRYAACCESQSKLRHSRSAKLRQKAELSCLKAAYVRSYKNKIVTKMIEHDISPQPYKIKYFVNSLFYDLIRRETTTANRHRIPSGYIAAEKIGTQ